MTNLDKSDFDLWLKQPITKELFKIFQENKDLLEGHILSLDVIYDNNLVNKLAYLRGGLEICEKLLNMTFDQLLIEEEKSDENEETPYPW